MSGGVATKRTPRTYHQQQRAWSAADQEEEDAFAAEEGRGGSTTKHKRSVTAAAPSSAGFLYDWVLAPLTGVIDRASSSRQHARPRHGMGGGTGGADATVTDQTAVTLESVEYQDVDHVTPNDSGKGADAKATTMAGGPPSPTDTNKSGGGGGGHRGGRSAGGNEKERSRRSRGTSRGGKTVRQIHEQYETSPLVVWFGLITKLVGSALATAGFAVVAALYPLYALTPSQLLDALSKGLFNVGYLVYMSAIGRWLHLRLVRSVRDARRHPHSRGIRPSVLSTCSVLPIPFLNDNYSYLLVDHATREAAAIDPADPYTVRDVAERLSLKLVAILTTHKHHDHAGGNFELQKSCGGTLAVYGHVKDSIPGVTKLVKAGDCLKVGETEIGVVHVPCHTTGHVVFAVLGDNRDKEEEGRSRGAGGSAAVGGSGGGGGAGSAHANVDDAGSGAASLPLHRVEALFTGDAIINGGVGAFFHGGPRDCYDNLHVRLACMPDAALVFSGHEYMLMNLRFAKWLDEDDEATAVALREVVIRRHHQLSTMPSSLAVERRVNPYFRVSNRAFLDKVLELHASIEAGKRKRWYRRYISVFSAGGGKKKEGGGGDGGADSEGESGGEGGGRDAGSVFAGVSVGQSLGNPTVAECVHGIKTMQDLAQYRHLLDQGGGGGGGGGGVRGGGGGGDRQGDEEEGGSRGGGGGDSGARPSPPPSPGPVSTGVEMGEMGAQEEESDDDTGAGRWTGRSAVDKRQTPKKSRKKKNEPPPELKDLLENL